MKREMSREALLIDFALAGANIEAPITTGEADIRTKLDVLVSDVPPEYSGTTEATWTLPSGVEVYLKATSTIIEAGYDANVLASEYEITFCHQQGQMPSLGQNTELVYKICIPAPGSIVAPSATRMSRQAGSPDDIDRGIEKILQGRPPRGSTVGLYAYFEDIDEGLINETGDLSVNDLAMLKNVLAKTTEFDGDPLTDYQNGCFQSPPADHQSVSTIQGLLDSVADKGVAIHRRKGLVSVPLLDPTSSAYISIYIDESIYGDLTEHARRSNRPEWIMTLVICDMTSQITHRLQLIRQLNGELKCASSMEMPTKKRVQPLASEAIKRVLEYYTPQPIPSSIYLDPDLEGDGANQEQLNFFSEVLKALV